MKKVVVFVGEIENKLAVMEVLRKPPISAHVFSVYGGMEDTLSETFKKPISKFSPTNFDVEVKEVHLRRFFSKLSWGILSVSNFVGKRLTNSKELIDYFVHKVGGTIKGVDYLYREAARSIENQPGAVYLVIDLDMDEAKKLVSFLPGCASIVQITKKDEAHEEGLPFFAFDPSEKSWKKSVVKMFESLIEKSKEQENGKQRNT